MGFPFKDLAPFPWHDFGNGSVRCSDQQGSKIIATREGHNFPVLNKRVGVELAKAIADRMNAYDPLVAAMRELIEASDAYGEDESEDSAERCRKAVENARKLLTTAGSL